MFFLDFWLGLGLDLGIRLGFGEGLGLGLGLGFGQGLGLGLDFGQGLGLDLGFGLFWEKIADEGLQNRGVYSMHRLWPCARATSPAWS